MMKNHEALVHFPIALILSAFIFSLIGIFFKRHLFKEVVFWNLIIGVIALAAAIYTGTMEQEQVVDPLLHEELDSHRRNAHILGVLIFYLVIWLGWRKSKMESLEYFAWVSIFFIASSSVLYQGNMGHNMSAKIQKYEIEASKKRSVPKPLDYGWNF